MNSQTSENGLSQLYRDYLTKARVADVEDMALFTETILPEFIREHVDHNFESIYSQTNRKFYDDIRAAIPVSAPMRHVNQLSGDKFSRVLKFYSEFLQSKFFPQPTLPKKSKGKKQKEEKIEADNREVKQSGGNSHQVVHERQETEGERKHVEFERAHRNPALRQRCIEQWGYRCQVCGIDMAQMYGSFGENFIEVHHLKPISTYDESRPDDYVENLVPLCPNCHAMIHHGPDGPLSLHDLRQAYQGPKYEMEKWKMD